MPEITDDYTANFDKFFINSEIEDFDKSFDPSCLQECEPLFEEFKK